MTVDGNSTAALHTPITVDANATTFSLPPAVRAQLLATEHWSLLATRSMTWSEIMARISIHLTVASAALVVLALVAQASGFGPAFDVLSIGLTSAILVLGTLTGVRVHNASVEDAGLIVGMNRLRNAYIAMDPSIADYLMTGWNDDEAGLMRTYTLGFPRMLITHVVGSTNFFIAVVNSIVAGTLGALITHGAGQTAPVVAAAAAIAGVAYVAVVLCFASRAFGSSALPSRFPSTLTVATSGDSAH
jgi:hypothetical protein